MNGINDIIYEIDDMYTMNHIDDMYDKDYGLGL